MNTNNKKPNQPTNHQSSSSSSSSLLRLTPVSSFGRSATYRIVPRNATTPSSQSTPVLSRGRLLCQLARSGSSTTTSTPTAVANGPVVINTASTGASLVNAETPPNPTISDLLIQIKRKDDQIKNLQRLNKNKTMQLLRKQKEVDKLKDDMKELSIEKIIEDNIDEPLRSVIMDQIRNKNKINQAHRYSTATKNFAQIIHYCSPKVLRILRQQFKICLPSPSTINRLTCEWNFTEGFNPTIVDALEVATNKLVGPERIVVLMVDEMAIDPSIVYDRKNDRVMGIEDQTEKGLKYRKTALAFVVQGVYRKFRQPIAYYLDTCDLNQEMMKIIISLQNVGLDVVAFIHDMGSNLLSTKKALGISMEKPYFEVNGKKVFFITDPPHLLKCLRNNLFNNMIVDTSTNESCDWTLIKKAFDADVNATEKLLPRVSKEAINLSDNRDKMNVKYAATTISGSMAFAITKMLDEGRITDDSNQSAFLIKILRIFNELFDIFNSDERFEKQNKKPFVGCEREMSLLKNADDLLSSLEVRACYKPLSKRFKSSNTPTFEKRYVSFIKCWRINISMLPQLYEYLKQNYDVESLPMKRFNQDGIENLFSLIRGMNGFNIKPDAKKFASAFKKLTVTAVFNVSCKANSEDDLSDILLCIGNVSKNDDDVVTPPYEFIPTESFFTDIEEHKNENTNEMLAGYFLRKLLDHHNCDACKDQFTSCTKSYWLSKKEDECNTTLTHPSEDFNDYISSLNFAFKKYIPDLIRHDGIVKKLAAILKHVQVVQQPNCLVFQHVVIPWFIEFFCRTKLYFLLREWRKDIKNKKKLLDFDEKTYESSIDDKYEDIEYLEDDYIDLNYSDYFTQENFDGTE